MSISMFEVSGVKVLIVGSALKANTPPQNLKQRFLTNIAFLIFSPVYSMGLRQETWQMEWAANWCRQVKEK